MSFRDVFMVIREHQRRGEVADVSVGDIRGRRVLQVRAVGEDDEWLRDLQARNKDVRIRRKPVARQNYHFLARELRPGSGVIRVRHGVPEGPAGTLTCFLSTRDGIENYLVAAGHVLSNFWEVEPGAECCIEGDEGSIYHRFKGFPATNITRFLGSLICLSKPPRRVNQSGGGAGRAAFVDIGIVELQRTFDLRQRTTCFGTFGEWPRVVPGHVRNGQEVMKCGAEEPHLAFAIVENRCANVSVYGPSGILYRLKKQVILRELTMAITPCRTRPTFAIPGDSGTMVVDRINRRPLGMLIAGSVLDGLYVMTPIRALWKFWTRKDLVLMRA